MKSAQRRNRAFTLLEVMIAMAIFFIAMFSVLNLMSRGLGMARALQQDLPSPGMKASDLYQLSRTNQLEDGGVESGDFEDLAPGLYPDFEWSYQTYQVASNGLFQADIVVTGIRGDKPVERTLSIFLFSPRSVVRGMSGAPGSGTRR